MPLVSYMNPFLSAWCLIREFETWVVALVALDSLIEHGSTKAELPRLSFDLPVAVVLRESLGRSFSQGSSTGHGLDGNLEKHIQWRNNQRFQAQRQINVVVGLLRY